MHELKKEVETVVYHKKKKVCKKIRAIYAEVQARMSGGGRTPRACSFQGTFLWRSAAVSLAQMLS